MAQQQRGGLWDKVRSARRALRLHGLRLFFPYRRHQYKATWTALSRTSGDAVQHVIGDVDEQAIVAAAQDTLARLERTVGIRAQDVVLEIGCGIGRVGQVVAPQCGQWIGCDVSPNMLRFARQRLAGLPNVRLVEVSGFDLKPIADASVDLVYCTVVFMHLDEWDRYNYVLEARRVLREGGRLFVDNFNLRSDEGWALFETCRALPPARRPAHISKASTPQEIEVYLRRAGFRDVRVEERGLWVQGWGVK